MEELTAEFQGTFPGIRPRIVVRAPGRVNLIGEHTDYNDGFVLPIAMSQSLHVVAGPSDDGDIAVRSTSYDETLRFPVRDPGPPGEPAWGNYVRGVAAVLAREGIAIKPGRLLIRSDVPIGGGVSSSAALEIGSAMAMLGLAGRMIEAVPLALLARRAEHEYAGSPCGIMDQFICVLGKAGHALLLDCRSQQYEQVPLVLDDACLLVMNTQVKHEIASGEYGRRQQQCGEGLSVIQATHPGVGSLRDVTPEILAACADGMDDTAHRRCRHVVTEIARTEQAATALRGGDLVTFGQLMFASHASLRDDYEVSCPELDALVEIARKVPGVYGARMTGGGFGGCAIGLMKCSAQDPFRAAVAGHYDTRFDQPAIIYPTTASRGAEIVPV